MIRRAQFVQALVIGLCLLLAIFLCAEAAHGHCSMADGGAHCQLCLLTHAAALPQALVALAVAFRMLALVIAAEPRRGSPSFPHVHRIRPPPAVA